MARVRHANRTQGTTKGDSMEAGKTPLPPVAGGHPVAGILLAVLFGLIAAGLIALTIYLMDITLCEDQLESGCSLDSSSVHTFKVIFGWAATVTCGLALVSSIRWRKGGSSITLIGAGVATAVFASMLFIL